MESDLGIVWDFKLFYEGGTSPVSSCLVNNHIER